MEQQTEDEKAASENKVETPVDRVAEIANEKLAEIEAAKENPEPKGAGAESSPEKPKTEEKTKDEIESIKKSTQARIDELTSEIYEERQKRDEDKKLVTVLEEEVRQLRGSLEKSGTLKTDEATTKESVTQRWSQYQQEDAAKPYAERREMSKEDLETFLVEDQVAGYEWMIARDKRRDRELNEAVSKKQDETKKTKEDLSQKEFVEKQNQAKSRLLQKYPDLNISKSVLDVAKEMFSEEEFAIFTGSDAELSAEDLDRKKTLMEESRTKIIARIRKDNKTYDEMMKIIESDEKKYVESANGPELVMLELDKRLGRKYYTEEELQKAKDEAAKAERDRRQSIDQSNPPSGPGGSTAVRSDFQKGPQYKEGLALFLQAGSRAGKNWTEQDYIKVLERRKAIPGANVMDEADAKAAGRTK